MTISVAKREKSEKLFQKSMGLIPGGVNSPVRAFRDVEMAPLIVQKGKGSTIIDIEGKEYIDFCMSWGALILGHSDPRVVAAVTSKMQDGSSFGIHTEIETLLAEKVISLVPAIEKVRFVSSGTESTATLVRLARGYTKRDVIVKFNGNYHGHVDALLVKAGSGVIDINDSATSKGIPSGVTESTICLEYNDEEQVKNLFARMGERIAAVIIEPVSGNMGVIPAAPSFIKLLREKTEETGALLIIDEVITGFRVGLHGASHHYGITPDLISLGKVVGGGFPVAALGGKKEIMDCLAPLGEVYQAGTLSGFPPAMAAGYATLSILEEAGFYEKLQKKMDLFLAPIEKRLEKTPHSVTRVGSMFSIFFQAKNPMNRNDLNDLNLALFEKFFHFLFERGVYIPPSPFETSFVSAAHREDELLFVQEKILEFIDREGF